MTNLGDAMDLRHMVEVDALLAQYPAQFSGTFLHDRLCDPSHVVVLPLAF